MANPPGDSKKVSSPNAGDVDEMQPFSDTRIEPNVNRSGSRLNDRIQTIIEHVRDRKKLVGGILLVLVIVIVVIAVSVGQRGTPKVQADTWWKQGSIYAVLVASYAESNSSSGYGNIQGLISKLPDIKKRGFDVIWISTPVHQAFRYPANEVENYTEIFRMYGNLDDFDRLVKEVHGRDMKLIIDLEINHSSDQHGWFDDSRNRKEGYEDLYIWHPGHDGKPPNNWTAVNGDSAWKFDVTRKEYVFHQFRHRTADFNYRRPATLNLMQEVFDFWLSREVDGIHIPNAEYLLEDSDLSDIDYSRSVQTKTKNRLESYTNVVQPLRQRVNGRKKNLFISADSSPNAATIRQSADAVFNRDFIVKLDENSTCQDFLKVRQGMANFYGEDSWPLWMSGTWDHSRLKSRLATLAEGFQVIQFLMRGTPVTYYGEEIGMEDTEIPYDATRDLSAKDAGPEKYRAISRDPFRTPMQWNSQNYSGFSNSRPYLPVNPDFNRVNVAVQQMSNTSLLHRVGRLNELRKEFLEAGQINPECRDSILYFERTSAKHRLVILVNFGGAQPFQLGTVGLHQNQFNVELSNRTTLGQDSVEFAQHGLVVFRAALA